MKKLSIILIMLGIALSKNTKAAEVIHCKNGGTLLDMLSSQECAKEVDKKNAASALKIYKELMEKQRLAKIQERQTRYDEALAQLKRDNPNFKKPLSKQTPTKQKGNEITRDDLIEYRRKTGNY
jgi:hypothetical protein